MQEELFGFIAVAVEDPKALPLKAPEPAKAIQRSGQR